MTNHTAGTTHAGPGHVPDAAVSALVVAVEVFVKTLAGDVPFGGGAYVLERVKAVREQMDQLTFAMLVPLAQMESSGELLAEGGQKSLKAYLTHAWGIPHGEAERLMCLAQNLHNETLPQTTAALEEGSMTVGEAAAIASGAEREVKKRDAQANPDADEYRSRIDTGLAGLKRQRPATSVKTLTSTGTAAPAPKTPPPAAVPTAARVPKPPTPATPAPARTPTTAAPGPAGDSALRTHRASGTVSGESPWLAHRIRPRAHPRWPALAPPGVRGAACAVALAVACAVAGASHRPHALTVGRNAPPQGWL